MRSRLATLSTWHLAGKEAWMSWHILYAWHSVPLLFSQLHIGWYFWRYSSLHVSSSLHKQLWLSLRTIEIIDQCVTSCDISYISHIGVLYTFYHVQEHAPSRCIKLHNNPESPPIGEAQQCCSIILTPTSGCLCNKSPGYSDFARYLISPVLNVTSLTYITTL